MHCNAEELVTLLLKHTEVAFGQQRYRLIREAWSVETVMVKGKRRIKVYCASEEALQAFLMRMTELGRTLEEAGSPSSTYVY